MGTGLFTKDQVIIREAWVREELASLPAGAKILDAGSGQQPFRKDCRHLVYKAQDFAAYDGAGDGSGQQEAAWTYGKLDYVCDIWKIPEADESFDAILCTEVLEHVPFPNETIAEFARLLKPGGVMIITVPFISTVHMAPYFFYSGFNTEYFRKMASLHGLCIQKLIRSGDRISLALVLLMGIEGAINSRMLRFLFRLSAAPVALFLSLFRRGMDPKVLDEGCNGIHVRAKKLGNG